MMMVTSIGSYVRYTCDFYIGKRLLYSQKMNMHGLELDPFQNTTTYHISAIHVPIYKIIFIIVTPRVLSPHFK
jgi:hypothetical protein